MFAFRRFLICLILFASPMALGQAALVIVDMQPFFALRVSTHDRPDNVAKLNSVLKRQKELILQAKKLGLPIIVVEYDHDILHSYWKHVTPDSSDFETHPILIEAISDYQLAYKVIKRDFGFFKGEKSRQQIEAILLTNNVQNLVVVGANASDCVFASIYESLTQGYRVWFDETSVIDFFEPKFQYPISYVDIWYLREALSDQKEFHSSRRLDLNEEFLAKLRSLGQNKAVGSVCDQIIRK